MIFELVANGKEMVYASPGFRRWFLFFVTVFCIAFFTVFWILFDGHRQDPFSPRSDHYPYTGIAIVGAILLLWFASFYQLKRYFHRMVVDGSAGFITIFWEGLFREKVQRVDLRSVDSFVTAVAPVSRYSNGWELRIRFRGGSELPIVRFYVEATALAALDGANKAIATSNRTALQDNH